jgi:parallel beta-helix repeat protein
VFTNNTVNSCYVGAFLSYAANATIANNTFNQFAPTGTDTAQYLWKLGAVYVFRSRDNQVSNNLIENAADGGITLLFSESNAIKGNRVSTSKYGIGLWFDANKNQIENNSLDGNATNMILDKTSGNIITRNNLNAGEHGDFDSGGDVWSKNHWSLYSGKDRGDGIGDAPYEISPAGKDPLPLTAASAIQTYSLPKVDWKKRVDLVRGPGYKTITGKVVWKNQTVNYVWGHLVIAAGGALTLNHSKLVGASGWGDEPGIFVQAGGSLEIDYSEIIGGEFKSPINIFVEQGGTINIRNSTLQNVGWGSGMEMGLMLGGDIGVIENNVFDGCYSGIVNGGGGHYSILNNTIRRCQFGIVAPARGNNSVTSGNLVSDIVESFHP